MIKYDDVNEILQKVLCKFLDEVDYNILNSIKLELMIEFESRVNEDIESNVNELVGLVCCHCISGKCYADCKVKEKKRNILK